MEDLEELPKRKLKLKRGKNNTWEIVRAQGFYPSQEIWTEEELRIFLKDNPDINPDLNY